MRWEELESFINAREPELLADAKGVEPEDIAVIEADLSLPRAYRDFLVRCGADAGKFRPLGLKWDHNFYLLIDDPPDDDFAKHGLLRIGLNEDHSAISPADIYLDVSDEDAEDGMLVEAETDGPYNAEWLRARGSSFLDQVTERAFRSLQLERHEHDVTLMGRHKKSGRLELQGRVREIVQRLDMKEVLASSERLVTVESEGVSGMIEAYENDRFVVVELRGDDRKRLGHLVEVLLDHVPELERSGSSEPIEDPA